MPRNPELNAYLARNARQDDVLAEVARETGALPNAGMLSRPDAGGLLTLLGRMLGAREVVEVGTFTGYGAICLARGLAEGGRLTCYEVSGEYAEIARRNVERARLQDRVRIEVGPAQQALERLPDTPHIDLAYVDADKPGYPDYYETLVPRLRPGGVVVLDNMLAGERVLDPDSERGRLIDALNQRIAADDRVESVLLGLSDGVTLARKRT
jgi:caffeoyl-CoA O-methyltransferase